MTAAIRADNPIRSVEDDALGRAKPARSFAEQVLSLDLSEGAVVGVLGPWGSGKTSFINLARPHLQARSAAIVDFNPCMFSGVEQLADRFFAQVSAKLRPRRDLAEVGRQLERYGEVLSGITWVPVVGAWAERVRAAAKALAMASRRATEDLDARRNKVEKVLGALDKPLVVVLDDIDRLNTEEIRDIFKLVRLTANFPNVVYVLAFDRSRVEDALSNQGIPGRDYLEKILQVAVDLPAIPADILNREVLQAIDSALSTISNPGPFDQNLWPDVFMEVVRPLIRNMRDVRRFAAAVHGTVRDLNGQVALVDVLALEAVRVFLPDVFREMHAAVAGLTTTSGVGHVGRGDESPLKEQIDGLIKTAGERGKVVRALVNRLFPAGERHIGGSHYGPDWERRWLRERRVAHEDILMLYLERVAGKGLQAFTNAEQTFARLADRDALDQYLRSLPSEQLEDVISSLETFEEQFRPEHVIPGSVVLLNLLPDLPERPRGMFDLGKALTVTRVVLRLLRSLKGPLAVETAVREILPALTSLSSKLTLITIVGHRENAGHKLVSEEAAAEFERQWRAEVRTANADLLSREESLLEVLWRAKKEARPEEPPVQVPDAPQVTFAVLRSARSEALSQSAGSRAVRRSPRLAWDALVELYGDEAVLRDRIEGLKAVQPADADELLQLAGRYLDGWRPKELGDD
ncbi:MAG TPA: P-loop NTPase fold protein [Gemmatimonadales bacterium]|nr:P-loop NTPase fold protein [Gemmatimonadales bacterium]